MKRTIRILITIFLTTFIITYIVFYSVKFFNFSFVSDNIDFQNGMLSAFSGAFFAFLFLRIGEILTAIYKRQKSHKNALVKIEFLLNKYQNAIAINVFMVKNFIGKAEKHIAKNEPFVYFGKFHKLPTVDNLTSDLLNIDLKNDLFLYSADVDKINSNIETLTSMYSNLLENFLNKTISKENFVNNIKNILENISLLKVFLNDLEKDNITILSKVRVLQGKKGLFDSVISLPVQKYNKNFEKKVKTERIIIEEEIKKIENNSLEKIKELTKKNETEQ